MLRLLVLALLLLNGIYFAWSHHLLAAYGFAPARQNEPQRVAQQIRPEWVRVVPVEEATRAASAAQGATGSAECLQAGLFDEAQAGVLRQTAQSVLPAGSWAIEAATEPARWIVYMGKYPDAQTLARKRSEIASLNLRLEPLTNPALDYGLSLGGFDTEARAVAELAALSQRGVNTARVVQERAEARGSLFKITQVDEAVRPRLEGLKPALAGKTLRACK